MDDPLLLGVAEGAQDVAPDLEDAPLGHRAAIDQVLERGAVDELEHDVVFAGLGVGPRGEHTDHVGVLEGGGRLRFPAEALQVDLVLGHAAVEHLQGDQPVEPGVAGQEHPTHPPSPSSRWTS